MLKMLTKDKDYFNHDDQFLRLKDDVIVCPAHNISVHQYLYGRCHLFAKVMSEKLGLDYGWMINDEPCQNGDCDGGLESLPLLNHAFCYIKTKKGEPALLVDARGLATRTEVIDDYTTEMMDLDNNIEVINPDELYRKWMNNGMVLGFLENEEQEISDFIDQMMEAGLLSKMASHVQESKKSARKKSELKV